MAEVVLDGLSFRYPGAAAETLCALDLAVASGEAHALLGGSGAGKSTLLGLLSGLLPAPAGCIRFDGRDVAALAPIERRVAQVFQFPVLYEAMTVRENLAFPLKCAGANRATRAARVAELAGRLGINALLDRRPAALTLVEKQLTAIGKALVRPDVSLVLLDEPLTAAEPAYKWQLRQTLKSLQAELGATMIYVTHDQTEALTFAERISVLHDGRILQTGTPEELVAAPAHEYVGYFVGSPGMNLVAGRIERGWSWIADVPLGAARSVDGPCRIGFRPEWAQIETGPVRSGSAALAVEVLHSRILGLWRDAPHGLVTARFGDAEITTRQALVGVRPGPAWLSIEPERFVVFRDGTRIGDGARAAG